ncbi:hypothetical protein J2792_002850 [Novosphingobium capsulatum]|uniref:VOC domain-containing protein n=1 Tax=Novosphingobium capsulatum TaxID=13688 RepID=A0ABU1MPN7_9SPHN|nr:VOC family protein [Novosphingobium capsulatum]MDR6511967.1 hypothetical protein [Novosphingobium capsulatum]
MILKTYARMFSADCDATLFLLERLHGRKPHIRFRFGEWELGGIGDILVVAGPNEALAPIRDTHGPIIVCDIEVVQAALVAAGAVITTPLTQVPTGRMLYARHPDGLHIEYVQWTDDLVERLIRVPQREGRLSSEL